MYLWNSQFNWRLIDFAGDGINLVALERAAAGF
jgi:hypothetical protein